MITEDYINFENAHLLKNAGFNEVTSHVYSDTKELLRLTDYGTKDLTNKDCDEYPKWQFHIKGASEIISAPTLQMAMKWLREMHKLFIEVQAGEDNGETWFDYDILPLGTDIPIIPSEDGIITYSTYEEACEAAIKYCLENLI